ncbi:MAG TPA: nuclear transport factor 2 family protein [Dehalococcoidia bacterium]|nr:nuclear transport factor 2 family protein [Dehalococcoidia bacterium]
MPDEEQRPLATIRRYYHGCSTGDRDLMMSTFSEDVVHYFPTHDPVRGAAALAEHWVRVHDRTDAVWTVDHGIWQGDEAVIEWSMRFRDPRSGTIGMIRGAEWYVFQEGRIVEIRPYYHPGQNVTELRGFPYAQRGYPLREPPN